MFYAEQTFLESVACIMQLTIKKSILIEGLTPIKNYQAENAKCNLSFIKFEAIEFEKKILSRGYRSPKASKHCHIISGCIVTSS
jgi:hypothetical protein